METDQNNNVATKVFPEIVQYVQALMVEKGNDILPAEIQAEMMNDLYTRFADYLLVNFAKAMEKEKFYEFEEMLEKEESQEKVILFIQENTDLKKVVRDTCDEFRKTYINT